MNSRSSGEFKFIPLIIQYIRRKGEGTFGVSDMTFEEFWRKLTDVLKTEQLIRNWSVHSSYPGRGDFKVMWKGGYYIRCIAPDAKNIQNIPKKDFQIIYDDWNGYLNRKIQRNQLTKMSRFTTYTISILHQYEHLF